MSWWRRWQRNLRQWVYDHRGYDVLTVKVQISKDLIEDGNPVTADLIAHDAAEAARTKTLERMGLVPS